MKKIIVSLAIVFGLLGTVLFISPLKIHAANVTVAAPTAGGRYRLIPIDFNQSAAIVSNRITMTFVQVPVGTTFLVTIDPLTNPLVTTLNPRSLFTNANVSTATAGILPDDFYNVNISWQRSSDNVVESVDVNSVIIDTTTLPITINSPNNGVYSTAVPIDFIVPEGILPGSLRIIFTNGTSDATFGFSSSYVNAPFTLNPRNINASPIFSSSVGSMLAPGTYALFFLYQDDLGNPVANTPGANSVTVLGDPVITINAPTKTAVGEITNTTVHVTAQEPIAAGSVVIRGDTTVHYSNYNCSQISITEVSCTIKITSSGNLVITTTAGSGLSAVQSVSNYVVTNSTGTPVPPTINSPIVSGSVITNPDVTPVSNVAISAPVTSSSVNLMFMFLMLCLGLIVLVSVVGYLLYQNPKIKAWIANMKFKMKK